MAKHPRSYPPDFRENVIALAHTSRRLDDLAHEFGLARQTVRNWVKQADLDSGFRSDGIPDAYLVHVSLISAAAR